MNNSHSIGKHCHKKLFTDPSGDAVSNVDLPCSSDRQREQKLNRMFF